MRTIGKTAVGSIDLIRSVDSKFEIIRSVEKILKDAVSSSKAASIDAHAEKDTKKSPENGNISDKIDTKNKSKSSLVDISAKKFP